MSYLHLASWVSADIFNIYFRRIPFSPCLPLFVNLKKNLLHNLSQNDRKPGRCTQKRFRFSKCPPSSRKMLHRPSSLENIFEKQRSLHFWFLKVGKGIIMELFAFRWQSYKIDEMEGTSFSSFKSWTKLPTFPTTFKWKVAKFILLQKSLVTKVYKGNQCCTSQDEKCVILLVRKSACWFVSYSLLSWLVR